MQKEMKVGTVESYKVIKLLVVSCLLLVVGCLPCFAAAPGIFFQEITSVSDTSVVITWGTDVPADAKIEYGIAGLTNSVTSSEFVQAHSITITGLTPNTVYYFRPSSKNVDGTTYGTSSIFKTLQTPSGTHLFDFAMFTDLQYAKGATDTYSPRGRKYSSSEAILNGLVRDINSHSPAFTVIKGDITEASAPGFGAQVATDVKPKLDTLTGGTVPGYSRKYFAIPGNHDKANNYGAGNWVDDNMKLLVPEVPTTSITATTDSSFNYSFDYLNYHFIMLDTVKAATPYAGSADATWLTNDLNANSTKKTFIFMHHPAGDVTQTIPTETAYGQNISDWQIDNIAAFQAIVKSHSSQIGAVFIGHVHDNNYYASAETTGGVPFIRTASALQFPQGYNIIKVYSGGFMQSFYKISSDPIQAEMARAQIGSSDSPAQSPAHWQQVWLGASSARNFTQTYSVLPAYPPTVIRTSPTTGATTVPTNSKFTFTFSQPMSTAAVETAFSMAGTYSWNSDNTAVTFTPSSLTPNAATSITVSTAAKDSNNVAMLLPYTLSFTTGPGPDSSAPTVTFIPFTNNITTNITPTLTGTAEDATNTISSVECRIDGSDWHPAAPVDGYYNSSSEPFAFTVTSPLSRGLHTIEARAQNLSGTFATSYDSYSFYVTGSAPYFRASMNGTEIMNNDIISSKPMISISIITASPLDTAKTKMILDGTNITGFTSTMESPILYTLSYKVPAALIDGTHWLTLEATDTDGDTATWEGNGLIVKSAAGVEIQRAPLNFPNPFDPAAGTAISYYLSKDSNIQINIYDLTGTLFAKKSYTAGTPGGNAGYNEVLWNGNGDSGSPVGNGMYLYMILADGKVAAKGKMVAVKR